MGSRDYHCHDFSPVEIQKELSGDSRPSSLYQQEACSDAYSQAVEDDTYNEDDYWNRIYDNIFRRQDSNPKNDLTESLNKLDYINGKRRSSTHGINEFFETRNKIRCREDSVKKTLMARSAYNESIVLDVSKTEDSEEKTKASVIEHRDQCTMTTFEESFLLSHRRFEAERQEQLHRKEEQKSFGEGEKAERKRLRKERKERRDSHNGDHTDYSNKTLDDYFLKKAFLDTYNLQQKARIDAEKIDVEKTRYLEYRENNWKETNNDETNNRNTEWVAEDEEISNVPTSHNNSNKEDYDDEPIVIERSRTHNEMIEQVIQSKRNSSFTAHRSSNRPYVQYLMASLNTPLESDREVPRLLQHLDSARGVANNSSLNMKSVNEYANISSSITIQGATVRSSQLDISETDDSRNSNGRKSKENINYQDYDCLMRLQTAYYDGHVTEKEARKVQTRMGISDFTKPIDVLLQEVNKKRKRKSSRGNTTICGVDVSKHPEPHVAADMNRNDIMTWNDDGSVDSTVLLPPPKHESPGEIYLSVRRSKQLSPSTKRLRKTLGLPKLNEVSTKGKNKYHIMD